VKVEAPDNPVMFGYGESAVRPGYGPQPTIYYYGGPALHTVGSDVTILATYGGPVTQRSTPKVSNIWGAPAIVATNYYEGKVVLFGPHPEWPGPGARMYAQALYYVASKPKSSVLEPPPTTALSEAAISDRAGAIRSTVGQIKPVLEETTRTAAEIVNFRAGDHYNPIGLWYDESLMTYCKELYTQLNDVQRYATKFQYEYSKLNILKGMVQNNPELLSLVQYSQNMISDFFNYTANLPAEGHKIEDTDWTGAGPFEAFDAIDEPTTFEQFTHIFQHVKNDTVQICLPFAENYTKRFQEYESLRIQNETAYTPEVNATLSELYLNISSSWPAGDLYKGMYTFRHPLDLLQYKIDYHLLNIITLADRTMEIVSYDEFALATAVGPWNYASAEMQAFMAHLEGAII